MYELFIRYIGSPWFLGNEEGSINIMAPTTVFAMVCMIILYLSMNSLNKSNFYSFCYSFVGCNVLGFMFYGYIAIPLCFLWVIHVKHITIERAKYYYIRNLYGHLGRWHEASDLDESLDYDKLIDETPFNRENMKKFYSSDISIWVGLVTSIIILIISAFVFGGYMFFPKAIQFV